MVYKFCFTQIKGFWGGEIMVVCKRNIELAMANSCMSYNDLADKSGLSRITIQKMLANKTKARPATVGKIAKALGISVEKLIETEAATSNQLSKGSESNDTHTHR